MSTSEQFSEVRAIADLVCSDCATQEQLEQLEQLLRGNPAAQQFYYDYLSMHMQLQSPTDNSMEFIYRRISEEFVVRQRDAAPPNGPNNTFDNDHGSKYFRNKATIIFSILLLVCTLVSIWWFSFRSDSSHVAKLVQGVVTPMGRQANIEGDYLLTGDYQVVQDASLEMTDGSLLHLSANSVIKLFNHNEIKLKLGKIVVEPGLNKNLTVHGKKAIMQSNGSGLTFDLTHNRPRLTTGKNTGMTPLRWRPIHYWGFNEVGDRVVDTAGNAHGIPANGATRIQGKIGQGAFAFANSEDARVTLGNGGGTAPDTGSFAVHDGVTIEALIKPDFTGELDNVDTIFHKAHGKSDHKVTLSLQNDSNNDVPKSKETYNKSLNFGLFILGQGYHELKLPLDGIAGRPSISDIKDNNYHHIVASYNVQTGLKAIYIDGKLLASRQYPAGSRVISGGPGTATVGNNSAQGRWQQEAYSGAIDELAFYDYALPEFMVKQHNDHINQGLNYFGLPANIKALPERPRLRLPTNTTFELDFVTGLPSKVISD
ncbi:LamG-like jellyroll fold domain-containing protein [Catenovulum maritimum]|uniref:Pentaxin domain-containing protein n=1 Tax=Catenovulum maritimum TaxID=1513271 RepID=A0A0J8H1Z9_9ALTE|nr:LamG-like jellyroll fold domain-containing protein [Catenovulum maritimum]KMT67043.1 pentaxin domain-containing protein [Catenovulum maritimum]